MLTSVPLLQFSGLWRHPTPLTPSVFQQVWDHSFSSPHTNWLLYRSISKSPVHWTNVGNLWDTKPFRERKPRGWDAVVFPAYMIWKGRNSPESETTNVNVMFRLSIKPLMETNFFPLLDIVDFPTDTYEKGVWSAFSTRPAGTLYFCTLSYMSCKYSHQHSGFFIETNFRGANQCFQN